MEWWHWLIIVGFLAMLGILSGSVASLIRYWRIKQM